MIIIQNGHKNIRRDIKFREWDSKTKYLEYEPERHTDGPEYSYINDLLVHNYEADGLYLTEFTGVQDIKGKDIYEGDIVEIEEWRDGKKYFKAKELVQFSLGMFHIYGDPLRSFKNIKIIGNIFQDPELLTNNKEYE